MKRNVIYSLLKAQKWYIMNKENIMKNRGNVYMVLLQAITFFTLLLVYSVHINTVERPCLQPVEVTGENG